MSGGIFRVTASPSDAQSLTLDMQVPGGWTTLAAGLRLRTDGRFHPDGKVGAISAKSAGGRTYLVNRKVEGYGHYFDDQLLAQKLHPLKALSAAWQEPRRQGLAGRQRAARQLDLHR